MWPGEVRKRFVRPGAERLPDSREAVSSLAVREFQPVTRPGPGLDREEDTTVARTFGRHAAAAQTRESAYGLSAAPTWAARPPLTAAGAAAAFEHEQPFTIGVEEELFLIDAETLELAPAAEDVLPLLSSDGRFARELRPSQLETVTRVCTTAGDACRELALARRDLAAAAGGRYRMLASGTHPFSRSWGGVTNGARYKEIADEYTWAAQRSLACGLHVHVAVTGAERALAVYNALRSYLPELAALGANSPYFEGRDLGMSSIRPKLNDAFPRSGVPPSFSTWDELIRFIDWGRTGGLFPDATHFWWELRPHLVHGTIEIRVADTQTQIADATAIVAVIHSLVACLSDRYDARGSLPVHPTHWIAENAWRAHRYGVRGWLVDFDTGGQEPARDRLSRLLTDLEPYAERVGSREELEAARALLAGNGADRQRYVCRREGLRGLVAWLARETERSAA
jgi:glutamate---cysteine ligase / carboxylate-amine ligase